MKFRTKPLNGLTVGPQHRLLRRFDPLVKDLIYVAVSIADNCSYCIHSHTAAARAKGMTPEMHAELVAVIGMAAQTNALVTAMQVEVDEAFKA